MGIKQIVKTFAAGVLLFAVCLFLGITACLPVSAKERSVDFRWAETSGAETGLINVPFTANEYADAYAESIVAGGKSSTVRPIKVKDGVFYFTCFYMDENFNSSDICKVTLHLTDVCDQSDQIAVWKGNEGAVSGTKKLKSGTYYLKIEFERKVDGDYTVILYAQTVPALVSQSPRVSLGTGSYYYNESGKDIYYRVDLKTSGLLYVDASYDDLSGREFSGAKITLYDAGKRAISCSTAQLDGESVKEYALEKGSYYVKVHGAGRGVYVFNAEADVFAVRDNTSKKKAENLSAPRSVDTLLTLSGKRDGERWYKFHLSRASLNKITIQNYSEEEPIKYAVYRGEKKISSGTLKPCTYISGDGSRAVVSRQSGEKYWKKGTYYVRIFKPSNVSQALVTVKRTAYIQNLSVEKPGSRVWNGSAQKPELTVKNGTYKLKKGTDYRVSYRNNKKVGLASVILTGLGKYKGSKEIFFKILPRGSSVTKYKVKGTGMTVYWEKRSGADGYQLRCAGNRKMKDAETVLLSGGDVNKASLKKLKRGNVYYVQVRTYEKVEGKKYFSKWSSAVKIRIE